MNQLIIIGTVPPPVHGCSTVTRAVINNLQRKNICVSVFDRSNRSTDSLLSTVGFLKSQFFSALRCWVKYLISSQYKTYIAHACGWGQWIDLLFIFPLIFKRGSSLYIHHHCFSYINKYTLSSHLIWKLLPRAKHIFLCERMREEYINMYGAADVFGITQSNLGVIFKDFSATISDHNKLPTLKVCFLSNITKEKGIILYISLAKACKDLPIDFEVAGPIAAEIEAEFYEQINGLANIKYVGPVYGDTKHNFLSKNDVLVFPSCYANEAEPLTVWEANIYGMYCISTERGCLPETAVLISDNYVFSEETFVDRAKAILYRSCLEDVDIRIKRKYAIKQSAQMLASSSMIDFQKLLNELVI